MIRAECAVFLAMLVGGLLAGSTATLFFAFGRASRVARAIFDFLTPIAVGAIFFFSLELSAEGVFRVYALVAFLSGILLRRLIHRKIAPWERRVARKILVPIKSLEESLEKRIATLLAPLRERWRARREAVREKREKRRAERAIAASERRERRERARRRKESARRERARAKAAARRGAREKLAFPDESEGAILQLPKVH